MDTLDPRRLVTGPEATRLPATATNPTMPPEYTPHSYGFMLFAVEADGYGGFSATLADGRQWLYSNKHDFGGDLCKAYHALVREAWLHGQADDPNPVAWDGEVPLDSRVKAWPNGKALPAGDPHTLCSTPRCSLGENHLRPCNEDAQPPA